MLKADTRRADGSGGAVHPDLDAFVAAARRRPAGAIGLLFVEDRAEVESTIRHHLKLGFRTLAVLSPPGLDLPPDLKERVHHVRHDPTRPGAVTDAVNRLIPALAGRWLYWGFNAEYLFYPFCETRSVGELTAFATEERRAAIPTFVVDLYAADLAAHPDGVSLEGAHFDRTGYYAHARRRDGQVMERQLDLFGGLRWRFQQHVAPPRRRIDRIGLFRAGEGLRLRPDHTLSDEEGNTYQCPWHHSVTAAICSFRAAKALRTNPGPRAEVADFMWFAAARVRWSSRQLMELGFMEPGQWF